MDNLINPIDAGLFAAASIVAIDWVQSVLAVKLEESKQRKEPKVLENMYAIM